MTEQEIIAKAKKALDVLQIRYENDDISVNYHENLDTLFDMLELDEEKRKDVKSTISVSFKDKYPNDLYQYFSVYADKETHKLLYVLTKHDQIPIPDELK